MSNIKYASGIILGCIGLIAGCGTVPGPNASYSEIEESFKLQGYTEFERNYGFGGKPGYMHEVLSDGTTKVTVTGYRNTTDDRLRQIAYARASELAMAEDYKYVTPVNYTKKVTCLTQRGQVQLSSPFVEFVYKASNTASDGSFEARQTFAEMQNKLKTEIPTEDQHYGAYTANTCAGPLSVPGYPPTTVPAALTAGSALGSVRERGECRRRASAQPPAARDRIARPSVAALHAATEG